MSNTTATRAAQVLGCQSPKSVPFRNMVKALSMHSWSNTGQEKERLTLALWARRNVKDYEAACAALRNTKGRN